MEMLAINRLFRKKSIEQLLSETQGKASLKKTLGALDLTMLGIGAIIGTGIFVLTGVAAANYAGPGLVLSFIWASGALGSVPGAIFNLPAVVIALLITFENWTPFLPLRSSKIQNPLFQHLDDRYCRGHYCWPDSN